MVGHDVIVVGGGVAGASAAYALARDRRVLLLEQFEFLHASGSSHGGSRIFRYAYEEPEYVDLAVSAGEGWRALERDEGERLLYRSGGLDIGPEGSDALGAIATAVRSSGQAVEELGRAEVSERFPAFALAEGYAAVYQPDAGVLAATRCVNALLRGAARRGATLLDRQEVRQIESTPGGVRVSTSAGEYEAGKVVVAAGAWLAGLLPGLGVPLRVVQQQVVYAGVSEVARHAYGRMPVFIEHGDGGSVYGFPVFDEPTSLKVADHEPSHGETVSDLGRRPGVSAEWARRTVARAATFLPGLTGEVRHVDGCLYTCTPDGQFVIGHLPGGVPGSENVVVAGGFSGHGFKFGPELGEVLRRLALDEAPGHDLRLFRPDRFA